jgi:alpha-glucoside transport system permease protein
VWLLPTAGAFIASLRPWAFGRTSGWWENLLDPSTWTLEPYRIALDASANNSFIESVVNSFAIAIPSTLIPLFIASAAAYAIVWIPFRGSGVLLLGILALIAVPIYGVLIPLLQAYVSGVHLTLPIIDKTVTLLPQMGLAGSIPGVWITHIGSQLPFSIFLLVFAIARVPRSLIDTARMDGASDPQVYWRVVIPLITPALAALGVLLFLWAWNDFIVALTIIGPNAAALPATVRFSSIGTIVDGPVTSAMIFIHSSVAIAVFFALQRYFVRGLLTGTD